jgi:hypothetical protein
MLSEKRLTPELTGARASIQLSPQGYMMKAILFERPVE